MGFLRRSNKRSSQGGTSKRASSVGGGGDAAAPAVAVVAHAAPAPVETETDSLATLSRGAPVWVTTSEPDVWLAATLDSVGASEAGVVLPDGSRALRRAADVLPANPPAAATAHDVTALSFLNEPAVLHGLAVRHAANEVYTRAGPVLVAVNPFAEVKGLYDDAAAARYGRNVATAGAAAPPPHIFHTAAAAYDAIARRASSVSIVINGESGAGKTETAKLAMRHITRLAGGTGVEAAVLASNPLLEAFGNAKTARNANSSRFGKLVTLRFDASARVAGARVQTFLLEKSRVAARPDGERSLHIFYQMLAGADAELKADLGLDGNTRFAYLAAGPMTVDGVDDAAAWRETTAALAAVGVAGDESTALFRLVAACLWLGNIEFDAVDDGEAAAVSASSSHALKTAARLLGVDSTALAASLTTRSLTVGGRDAVTKRLRPDGAAGARDALAKAVYACAFDWLVGRVNDALQGSDAGDDAAATPTLSILDIYGFECFADNGFEQLAINTANEHLQAQFNAVMLAAEQDEYAAEGVDWARVAWRDNAATLAALDARPPHGVGVLALLDEACVVPGGSDTGFGLRVAAALADSPAVTGCPRGAGDTFSVDHAAGVVTYTTAGFLDRNRDVVPADAVTLLAGSAAPLAQQLAASAAALASRRGATVMASFRDQLRSLIAKLGATELQFVRCIKPNAAAAPALFDGPLVAHQLRCAGVTEVARIARTGYPTRVPYAEIAARFGVLVGDVGDDRATALAVVSAVGVPPSAWQAGRTKLFLRAGVLASIESALARVNGAATAIAAAWRGARARAAFKRARSAAVTLQAAERARAARVRWAKLRAAAVVIQRAERKRAAVAVARRELEGLRAAKAARDAEAEREAAAAAAAAEAEREAAAAAAAAEAEREAAAAAAPQQHQPSPPARVSEPCLVPPPTAAAVVDPGDGWRVRAPAGFVPAGSPPPRAPAVAAHGAPPRRVSAAGSAPPAPLEPSHEVALWAAYADRLEAQVAQLIAHNRGLHGALAAVRSDLAAVVAAGSTAPRRRGGAPAPAAAPPSERSAAAAHAAALRAINELGAELGRKADAFADDAAFLTEVATGLADAPGMHAAKELDTLRHRFDAFAADFERRMAGAEAAVLGDAKAAALRREREARKAGGGAPAADPPAKPASAGRKVLGLVARAGGA